MKIYNSERGVALYLGIMIMIIILSIGLGISLIMLGQMRMVRRMGDSVTALSAADTGIERILYQDKYCREQAPSCPGSCRGDRNGDGFCDGVADTFSLIDVPLANGARYSVKVSEPWVFESKGTFGKVSRAIEIFIPYYKRVFATSLSFTGDLVTEAGSLRANRSPDCDEFTYTDGLTAADAICNCLAKTAIPPLPGTYKAWITDSDPNNAPKYRFATSTIPYRTPDTTLIAKDWDDLVTNGDDYLINPIGGGGWTNTLPDGTIRSTLVDSHCDDWREDDFTYTGGIGSGGYTDINWTSLAFKAGCDFLVGLYCFQQ